MKWYETKGISIFCKKETSKQDMVNFLSESLRQVKEELYAESLNALSLTALKEQYSDVIGDECRELDEILLKGGREAIIQILISRRNGGEV